MLLVFRQARGLEILAFPSVQLLDVTRSLQVFAAANEMVTRGAKSDGPYRVNVVAPGGASVTTSSGLGLLTQPLPLMDGAPDTLLVAGFEAGCLADLRKVDWAGGKGGRQCSRVG